ncbi:mucin-binding protein [Limosilactobacillus mucosae]
MTHGAVYDAIAKLIPGYHLSVNTLSPKTVVIDADTFDKASDGVFTVADTVYYIIDDQLANVNYVDDDSNEKVVTMEQTTGKSGAKSSYDSAATLNQLIYNEQTNPTGQYDLVSDGAKDGIVFDLDDQVDQTFVVHLKHHILKQSAKREKTIKQTVLYKYADGTQAADPYHGDDMTFKQTGDLDMVTGMIDWNGIWTTDERQGKFVDVSSPTIKGYTPDVTVLLHSPLTMDNDKYDSPIDLLDIVTYSPNDQMAIIKYVDIDNGGSLVAYDEAKGKTNEQINYDTKNQLSQLVYDAQTNPAGKYVLVSDGFAQAQAAAQAKGEQLRFDNDDQNYQLFTIYLRHHYSQVEPEKDPASGMRKVSQIIHYVYQNSQQSAANDNVQILTFKRTGYRDDVTGQVSWPLWKTIAAQKTNVVDSPMIKGYTPDNSVIGENEIAAAQKDDVVIYVNYTADPQHAQIDYVDQDTGQTIQSDKIDGVTDAKIDYSTADQIKQLTNKGYVLVSDEFTQAQATGKAVFDQDGNALQTFIVTLKHGTQVIDPNNPDPDNPILPATPINPADPTGLAWPAKDEYDQTVQAIVHYQDDDGNTMAPDNVQTARWTRVITVDKVTGRIIAATDWTSDPTEYATVSSPVIDGCTPDQTTVAFEMTPTDQVKTVIYAKNAVPVELEQPTKPSQPIEPEQPTEPSQPVEPEQPTEPSQPVEPEQPTEPSQLVEPLLRAKAFSQASSVIRSQCRLQRTRQLPRRR